jgi:CAI-1 autoinducer synthase
MNVSISRSGSSTLAQPGHAPLPLPWQHRMARDFQTRWDTEWGGRFILHGRSLGSCAVHLDGNDYLGVSGHPRIVNAQIATMRNSEEVIVQSGVFFNEEHPSRRFEKTMARWMGHEDGLLFQSGYAANVGLLQSLANAQTPVYLDALAHASLWQGTLAARAPGHMFRHNDPNHLERMIKRHGAGVVVVDAVYSTNGSLCPLAEIVAMCERHACVLVVDESHSLGTHGPEGAGLCAQLGLSQRVHFITASLAKSFAARAGFVSCPENFRFYLLTESHPTIFSSGLLAHELAGLMATYEVVRESQAERVHLKKISRRLRQHFLNLGYPVHQGTEQIIGLEVGSEPEVMQLRDAMEAHGIVGAIFCRPATAVNRPMLRLTLNAKLTEVELHQIEKAATEVASLLKPWNWPLSRRRLAQAEPVIA